MADGFGSSPQFDTAQYSSQTKDSCGFCGVPLQGQYYRLNGKMACPNCATRIQASLPGDSHATFVRAIAFGVLGSILGLALYAAVEIATGWTIGYLALAVGFIVAKLMMIGSKGIGGRRYQIAAVALTYIAISLAAVPVFLFHLAKQQKSKAVVVKHAAPGQSTSSADQDADAADQTPAQDDAAAKPSNAPAPRAEKPPMSLQKAILVLIGLGLASPFLELTGGVGGIIGMFILFIGLRIAWQMAVGTPRATVDGPYTV